MSTSDCPSRGRITEAATIDDPIDFMLLVVAQA
jgi:hypothetical protein